jgi:hypothetical protein
MDKNELLLLKAELIENFNNYARGLDGKNWELVRSCFSDQVYIDYGDISAGTGAADEPRKAEDWLEYLKVVINGFDFTQHTITNHSVTVADGIVNCRAYVQADHVILADLAIPEASADQQTTVFGEYSNDYEQQADGCWTICKSALHVSWSSGNTALFIEAMTRSSAQGGAQ